MSSQFGIYATKSDMMEVGSLIGSVGESFVAFERTKKMLPRLVGDLTSSEQLQFAIARNLDFDSLRWSALGDGRDLLDDYRSPVILINRPHFDGRKMTRGRFFLHKAYFDDANRKVEKPEAFLNWARALFRMVKGGLFYDKSLALGTYVGPEARSWLSDHKPYDVTPSGVIEAGGPLR